MIEYVIPGRENFIIENVCFDYNGTIACDGKLIEGVKQKIAELKNFVNVYILTADTYGTVEKQCEELGAVVKKFDRAEASLCKEEIIKSLGKNTAAVGNGLNDIQMFDNAVLSIAVIEKEGLYSKLINHSDIVVYSIIDAIDIILNKDKMKALLRN